MTEYYKDLTYYSLHHFENAQNIGWINEVNEHNKGSVPSEFIDNLWLYVKRPFNEIRGNLNCCLCNGEKVHFPTLTDSVELSKLGLSEIRVISETGEQKYAAPSIMLHYISEHGYCPPEEFIKAVINGPKPGSSEYQAYEERYNIESLWGESDETVIISEKLRIGALNNNRSLIHDNSTYCDIITRDGSLLNVAIKSKHIELAKDLILLGADLNKFSGIELNNAVFELENEVVQLLLSHKIMINVSTPKLNPLFTAIRKGNYEASKLLLENGINVNLKYTNEFMKNMDAYTLARHSNREQIVDLLKEYI